MNSDYPMSSIGLSAFAEPLRVLIVDAYGRDIVGRRSKIAEGRRGHVFFDLREGSATRFRLYHGAKHPKVGGVLIDLGSREEGTVVAAISRWLDSEECERHLTDYGRELVGNALLHLGDAAE